MSLLDFNEFKWRAMTAAINQIIPAPRLLQDLIFRNRNSQAADHIDVDVVVGGKKILPFVSPIQGGVVVDKLGRYTRSVIAPRLRPKKPFSAQELLTTRATGSNFYVSGAGDLNKYRQEKVGRELQDLRNRIDTTIEWMCAQALTGSLSYDGESIAFAVDYQMPDANKPTLLTTARWGESAADILGNLDDWGDIIINSVGMGPTIGILGKTAAKKLRADTTIKDLLDNRRTNLGSTVWRVGNNYIGNLNGIDFYRYGNEYTDLNDEDQNFIADNVCILVAPQARFSIEFAQIIDLDAGANVVGEYFSKSWLEKDPSQLWILAESRPLPVPWQPEAIVYATVCASAG